MMLYDFMIVNGFDLLLGCLEGFVNISVLNLFFSVSTILLVPTILFSSRKVVKNILTGVTSGVIANGISKVLDGKNDSSKSGSSNNNSGGKTTGDTSDNKTTGGNSGGNSTGGNSGGNSTGSNSGGNSTGGNSGGK